VAPPYPGAFGTVLGERWTIGRTQLVAGRFAENRRPHVFEDSGSCYVVCGDGGVLKLLAASRADGPIDLGRLAKELAPGRQPRFL
jgi:hypothetical protein